FSSAAGAGAIGRANPRLRTGTSNQAPGFHKRVSMESFLKGVMQGRQTGQPKGEPTVMLKRRRYNVNENPFIAHLRLDQAALTASSLSGYVPHPEASLFQEERMASYRGHLTFSSMLGVAYGALGGFYLNLGWGPAFLGGALTTAGGLLPDL